MAFLSRNILRDDKITGLRTSNSKESIEEEITSAIYPDSVDALHHLKLAVKNNRVVDTDLQEKFKKETVHILSLIHI